MALIVLLIFCFEAHAVIWGHYKLYESKGPALYDFAGNGNHAEAAWSSGKDPILTDRGLYLDDYSYIKFPNNIYKGYPSKNTMIIVMWIAAGEDGNLIIVESGLNKIYLYWKDNSGNVRLKTHKNDSTEYKTSMKFGNINLDQWNLVVFHLEQVDNITRADVYEATSTTTLIYSKDYSGFQLNSPTTTWSIKELQIDKMDVFIYEVWWLNALEASIQNTISTLSFVRPYTFTSPVEIDPFKTYNGMSCDNSCTSSKYSCRNDSTTCISFCGIEIECSCGCYNVNGAKCLSCYLKNCSTYDPTSDSCSVCKAGYYKSIISHNVCQQMVSYQGGTCGNGYYFDTGLNTCLQCPSNCSSCTSDTVCTGCISGYALITDASTTLCNVCPTGQYATSNLCWTCPELCTACTGYTVCTSCVAYASVSSINNLCYCDSGFTYVTGGSCTGGFGASAIMNSDGTISISFSGTLNPELTGNVLSFKDGSIVYDSSTFTLTPVISLTSYTITFIKILLKGWNTTRLYFPTTPNTIKSISNQDLATQFIDINIVASSITTSCSSISNCYTCSLSGLNYICDSCRSSLCIYSDPIIRCGACCDSGYYQNTNACIKCASNCNTCTDGSPCSGCIGSLYLLNGNCVSDCGSGKYKESINNICSDCILNCDACLDSSSCTTCASGYIYNSANSACEACPALCRSCSSSSICVDCDLNASITGGLCVCNTNYTNINNSCVSPETLHATVDLNDDGVLVLSFSSKLISSLSPSSIAILIDQNTYNFPYFTISEIEANKVYSIILNVSLLGIPSLRLAFIDPSSILSADMLLLGDSEIKVSVPAEIRCNSYNICEVCTDICLECSESKCIKCANGYLLHESVCLFKCPDGYYQDIIQKKCIVCNTENCKSCEINSENSSQTCLECNTGYIMARLFGKIICIPYSYSTEFDQEVCNNCYSQCSEYSGEINCSVCIENTEIISSECRLKNDNNETNTLDIELTSATLEYIEANQFMLYFESGLMKELLKEYMLLYKNNILLEDRYTIKSEEEHTQKYIITIDSFNINKDNTIYIEFLNDIFLENQSTYLSVISLLIPAQTTTEGTDDSDYTDNNDNNSDANTTKVQILNTLVKK